MTHRWGRSVASVLGGLVYLAVLPGCAAGDADVSEGPGRWLAAEALTCLPGRQEACVCKNGLDGVHRCLSDGTGYTACECPDERWDRGDLCGNGKCEASRDEHCHSCPEDCGACAPCDIAPACEDAMIPPEQVPHIPDLDVPKMLWIPPEQIQAHLAAHVTLGTDAMRVLAAALDTEQQPGEHPVVTHLRQVFAEHPAATAKVRRQLALVGLSSPASYRMVYPERRPQMSAAVGAYTRDSEFPWPVVCGDPRLRVGVHRIVVHEEDDDIDNDIVYCVVQAEAVTGAEIRVTPKTPNLDEGEDYVFSLNSGVFWGQLEPTTPGSDLFIAYDCIEADTDDGYANLLFAIGEASMGVGGTIPGDSGWIFSAVGIIATIVGAALALDGDDYLFSATQTVPEDTHLALTNGAYWTVRREGTHLLSDWDWELFIKAWGCAEFGTL